DRWPGIARGLSLLPRPREWDGRAREHQKLLVAADVGMAQVPAGVRRERDGQLRQHDAGHLVAVLVHRGDEGAEGTSGPGWNFGPVEGARPGVMARVRHAGDSREHGVETLRWHGGAVRDARVPARRRLDAFDDPAIEVDETGAQERGVIDDAAEVSGVLDR